MQLVLLALHLRKEADRRPRSCPCRAAPSRAPPRAGRARARPCGIPSSAACLRRSLNQGRYLGRFQGSMAPCARLSPLSGITRFRSKSTVLPNPWQRGHAPKGLLKLNSRGSGSLPGRWQLLHSYAPENAVPLALRSLVPRNLLEDHLAAFAVGNLRGIHNAGAVLRTHHHAVQQHKHGQRKVQVQQRLGRRELDDPALLIEPVEAA